MKTLSIFLLFLFTTFAGAAESESTPLVDQRIAVYLDSHQKAFVLESMRRMLETLTAIQIDLLNEQPEKTGERVESLMLFTRNNHPEELRDAMPLAFKQISQSMNKQWQVLLQENQKPKQIQRTITAIMSFCNGCHRAYKIE